MKTISMLNFIKVFYRSKEELKVGDLVETTSSKQLIPKIHNAIILEVIKTKNLNVSEIRDIYPFHSTIKKTKVYKILLGNNTIEIVPDFKIKKLQ